MAAKQVVLTFSGNERVEDIVPHIDKVAQPGTQVVFIFSPIRQSAQEISSQPSNFVERGDLPQGGY